MTFYIEPINLRQWNLFDKVKGPGHVEPFLATRDMQIGDIVMLHVGKQDPAHESGIYAYGTVIYGPYILTKTFDPSMTVAALECAALQRCSFLLSIKVRTPCTGHSVRGDFFLLFLLACLCELHRIRIVQAEMGLAGSRTSFSFPPNRKPSFLSAIFCICHHVCPLVHPNLPVTAFGWQFLYRGCVFVVTVFLLAILQALPLFETTLPT